MALSGMGAPALAQGPSAFSDPGARQSGGAAGGAGGDGLVAVEPAVDGGTIPIGATAQVVIRFKNAGSQPVETGLIRLYPSSTVSANTALNQCEEAPLAAGAECAVALSVKGLQAGAWRVEMLMSHSGRTRLVTATVSGNVETTGEGDENVTSDIQAIPDEVDFESLNASQTLVEPVILRNITSVPINVQDVYVDGSDSAGFGLKADCKKLEPGQACIATVSWSPKMRGKVSGALVVKHDGPSALTSVTLRGEYEPDSIDQAEIFPEAVPGRGLMVSSQEQIDFGDGISTASTITVSLVNVGDAPLKIKGVVVAGSDNGLGFKAGGCEAEQVLDPIEACPLTVSWSPTRAGALLDDIQITHDGARGVLILPVRGIAASPVSQDQGTVLMATTTTVMGGSDPGLAPGEERSSVMNDDPVVAANSEARAQQASRVEAALPAVTNPKTVLDGLKITSFSPTRAIIAGPGGSRIVFDDEEIVLGGVSWMANIQRNGIEFSHGGETVLLLFDRSLSSINAGNRQSGSSGGSSSSAAPASTSSSSSSSGSSSSSTSESSE